jgi:hypothetical protein
MNNREIREWGESNSDRHIEKSGRDLSCVGTGLGHDRRSQFKNRFLRVIRGE